MLWRDWFRIRIPRRAWGGWGLMCRVRSIPDRSGSAWRQIRHRGHIYEERNVQQLKLEDIEWEGLSIFLKMQSLSQYIVHVGCTTVWQISVYCIWTCIQKQQPNTFNQTYLAAMVMNSGMFFLATGSSCLIFTTKIALTLLISSLCLTKSLNSTSSPATGRVKSYAVRVSTFL